MVSIVMATLTLFMKYNKHIYFEIFKRCTIMKKLLILWSLDVFPYFIIWHYSIIFVFIVDWMSRYKYKNYQETNKWSWGHLKYKFVIVSFLSCDFKLRFETLWRYPVYTQLYFDVHNVQKTLNRRPNNVLCYQGIHLSSLGNVDRALFPLDISFDSKISFIYKIDLTITSR